MSDFHNGTLPIAYTDASGAMRAAMDTNGITYYDENGIARAGLGRVETTTPATGAETTYPAAVVLYDAEGNVIWRAPQ